ncbi:MAG: DUF86 domain-containing protein [Candidatus Poribacteria bacterium]
MRDHKLYMKDIIEAMESIEKFIEGMDFNDFILDDKTSSAVIRKLEIMGEATKAIPEQIKSNFPQIPWKAMAGMRDKLIHFYFGVDYALLWETVTHRIPQIKPLVNQVAKNL